MSPRLGGGIDSEGGVGIVTADGHSRDVIGARLCQPVIGTAEGGHTAILRLTIGGLKGGGGTSARLLAGRTFFPLRGRVRARSLAILSVWERRCRERVAALVLPGAAFLFLPSPFLPSLALPASLLAAAEAGGSLSLGGGGEA